MRCIRSGAIASLARACAIGACLFCLVLLLVLLVTIAAAVAAGSGARGSAAPPPPVLLPKRRGFRPPPAASPPPTLKLPPPCCDCSGVHRRRDWKRALGAIVQAAKRTRAARRNRTSIGACANLAPAGTGTRTLYKRLAKLQSLYKLAPRRAYHDHWRVSNALYRAGARCFVITLRDPAERMKTAWAFLEQQSGAYLPYGRQQQAPLKVLMRNFRLVPNRLVSSFPRAPGADEKHAWWRPVANKTSESPQQGALGEEQRSAIVRRLFYASNSDYDWLRRRQWLASGGRGGGFGPPMDERETAALSDPTQLALLPPHKSADAAAASDHAPSSAGDRKHAGAGIIDGSPSEQPAATAASATAASAAAASATGVPQVWPSGFSWERKREPFLIAQIFYLAPIFLAHPELELHVLCTRNLDADWRRFVEHFGLIQPNAASSLAHSETNRTRELPVGEADGVSTIRSQSSRTGTSSRAKRVQLQINSSHFFSKQAQEYVRKCLFAEDWALVRLLGCSA